MTALTMNVLLIESEKGGWAARFHSTGTCTFGGSVMTVAMAVTMGMGWWVVGEDEDGAVVESQ